MTPHHGQPVSLHYRREGGGAPVTLLHGVGSSLEVWDGVVRATGENCAVLRVDLRGHGRSGKPPGPYKLDDFVRDLAGLYEHLGIEQASLVGFSLGGVIAQAFALAHPEKVNRLVLISAVAGRTPAEAARVRERARMIREVGARQHAKNSAGRWFTDGFQKSHPEIIARHFRRFIANDPEAYSAAYQVLAESDLSGRLTEISQPTLIITGEHDIGSTPRMAELMHQKIARSELHILPGLKHALLLEAPAQIAGLIRQFITPASTRGRAVGD
ncbi:MAG: alpha/beta hydrolase [Gammaproteobacteria bacterium]|nr:alpha/beta hydrolase [Gammaproteobacteria bacterium]